MISKELISPQSIVVVGGSNNTVKPGGKIIKNILSRNFEGNLYAVNPNETEIQGIPAYNSVNEIPTTDLAILAIPAKMCLDAITVLIKEKATKAFIILSAGFGELNEEGKNIEDQIVALVNKYNATLIGPNCIGVLTSSYNGVFTSPLPTLSNKGCDFISSSGATAVFLMEAGMQVGLKFANVFSIGNGKQTSVEDVLEYMDETYHPEESSSIKLLYLENIENPQKFLKHTSSLINKGCKIAAIKSGATEAGSMAAASHTGAIASSDKLVRALFRKAGVVYCSSRNELITVASVFNYKQLKGKNIAIITHAGGSAVMLADTLSKGGLVVPKIEGEAADKLLSYLHTGSSVSNPIDFLATGTADQLGIIIDYCEHKFEEIDAMVVVFGSPGLFDVENVYKVLSAKLDVCKKPIYPVLPSVLNAQKEIQYFLSKGYQNFPDEVILGTALAEIYNTPLPINETVLTQKSSKTKSQEFIKDYEDGFLPMNAVNELLDLFNIDRVKEELVATESEALKQGNLLGFPLVMKVVGPIHKTDVGGVKLGVASDKEVALCFNQMMKIEGAKAVQIQQMKSGIELFVGVAYDEKFGHSIHFGLGGIFIEVFNDVQTVLLPTTKTEVSRLLKLLKGYPLIKGVRGKKGIDEEVFTDIILKVAQLVINTPQIVEMDINPLIGEGKDIVCVDARISIKN